MDHPLTITLFVFIILFLTLAENAFVLVSKLSLTTEKRTSNLSAKSLAFITKHPSRFILSMITGTIITLVITVLILIQSHAANLSTFTQNQVVDTIIQILFLTGFLTFFFIFLSKMLAHSNPNKLLKAISIPTFICYVLLLPITLFLVYFSNWLSWVFLRIKFTSPANIASSYLYPEKKSNVKPVYENQNQEIEHGERIIQNALDFNSVKLRECVVPRPEIVAISINDSVENLKQRFIETGFSKILVYENNIDNIVGFAPSITLLKKPNTIASMVIKLPVVPETMPANKLLEQFIQDKKSIALVVDEFGGTAGIVTLEDIIEEIIGDIQDEHDRIKLEERQLSDTEYRFSGRLEIDFLNEKYNLNLPASDDYETIAGMILTNWGAIPKTNDSIIIGPFTFRILKASKTKIESVLLKI